MLEDLGEPAQFLRVAGTSNDRQWVETQVLMMNTDMKEQWGTVFTYGYGCVSCLAPHKYDQMGELYVPFAGRDMQHTRGDVLRAQQFGEYGSSDEWRRHLHGASRSFVLQDPNSGRLDVLYALLGDIMSDCSNS